MEFRASHRYARISPTKVRPVVDLIRGKHVNDALQILRATPKRGAYMVDRVLRSAIANADESLEADMENLRVERVWVEKGPSKRRFKWRFRARGRAAKVRNHASHIHVVLDDGQ